MKVLKRIFLSFAFLGFISSNVLAGSIGVGVTGMGVFNELSGEETMKAGTKAKKDGVGVWGAAAGGYVQYMFGDSGFVVGVEVIPGKVQSKVHGKKFVSNIHGAVLSGTETDWVEASALAGSSVTNTAQIEIDNYRQAYVETPAFYGLFLKAGYAQLDINTLEKLDTGSSYGDVSLDGTVLGIGFRGTSENNLHMKISYEQTDWDNISLTSSGSDVNSTVTADIDTYAAKVSLGYQF